MLISILNSYEPEPQATYRRIPRSSRFVFGGTRIVNVNFACFQDIPASRGLDHHPISGPQVFDRDARATAEELRTIHDVYQFDAGSGASALIDVMKGILSPPAFETETEP